MWVLRLITASSPVWVSSLRWARRVQRPADQRAWQANVDAEAADERLLKLTQAQFDRGYASGLALLAVQQTWLQARLARVAAYSSYLGDTVALYQALGGGWQAP